MAITKIQSESLNLADTYAFTGTVTGAGQSNAPSFEAHLSANQNITDATQVKIQYNTELFDSDGCYDNSTNYRFTPTTAGKYFIYHKVQVYGNATNDLKQISPSIYKNGSQYAGTEIGTYPDKILHNITVISQAVIDMNGSSDYVEAYCFAEGGQSTSRVQYAENRSAFGGFLINS